MRTDQQNKALHVYFRAVANDMNDAGYHNMLDVLKPGVEIPVTEYMVKHLMWHPVAEAMLGNPSTTKLNKLDVDAVYQVFSRHLAERFGITTPFPSEEIE